MAIWQFSVQSSMVRHGGRQRRTLTECGCNEPFKDRYWCPKKRWFMKEACPFVSRHECRIFHDMCGRRLAAHL